MTTDEARVCESDTTTTFANRLLTVDTAGLVAVVRTVVNFVTLFGAVDAGSVTTLELIRPTCEQGCRTHGIIFTITAAKFSGGTDLFKDKETLLILFPKVLLERCKRDNVLHPDPAAISQTKFSFTEEKKLMEIKNYVRYLSTVGGNSPSRSVSGRLFLLSGAAECRFI